MLPSKTKAKIMYLFPDKIGLDNKNNKIPIKI